MRKTLTACLLLTGLAGALPEGGQVRNGQIQIQGAGNILEILQSSPQGIINWSSFNISPQEIVRFLQPYQGVLLNRVTGQQASLIEGLLQANGRIFLLNPNGILFTPTAQVNAGSFVASTLAMSDQDFLQGNYRLTQLPDQPLAAIVNQGRLEVADGGYLVLTAPLVHNEGLIVARQGQVSLGASTEATISFDPEGLLNFSIPDGWRGTHHQDQGTVLLTPGQLTDSLSGVLGVPSSQEAASLPRASGILVNTGSISTDGAQGGNIYLDSSQATLNVRGGSLLANAEAAGGRGGRIDILSAGTATSTGALEARGGEQGQGGFIELSGQSPNLFSVPDVSAYQGVAGTILLDPDVINFVDAAGSLDGLLPTINAGSGPSNGTVSIGALQAIAAGTILLEANTSINWIGTAQNVIALAPGVNLNLQSGGTIFSNPGNTIQAQGGEVTLQAPGNIQAPAITSPGGKANITSASGRITLTGDVTADEVNLNAEGMIFTNLATVRGQQVNINAAQFLGSSTLGNQAQVDASNLLLTINGPNDTAAGAAALVQGPISNINLTTGPGAGDVFVNGVKISPSGGGTTPSLPSHGESSTSKPSPPGERIELPPLLPSYPSGSHDSFVMQESSEPIGDIARAEALQATSQQIINLGNIETDPQMFGQSDRLMVKMSNRSLTSSSLVPLYTLELVSAVPMDEKKGFWQHFIEQFIIWEDDGEEE